MCHGRRFNARVPKDHVIENAADQGVYLSERLNAMMKKYPVMGEVRGKGLFWAIELVKNRETHEPFVPFNAKGEQAQPMAKLMAHAMSKGLYLSSFSNIIRLSPPLIINRQEMSDACDILDELMMMANDSLKK